MTLSNSTTHAQPPQASSDTPFVAYYGEGNNFSAPAGSLEASPLNELERLREILYGRKTKVTDDRLGALENQVRTLEEQLNTRLGEEIASLRAFFVSELEAFQRQYNSRLDQHAQQFARDLESVRREFSERLETQDAAQAEGLRATRKSWMEQLDALAATYSTQVREVHQDLSDRIHTTAQDQTERLKTFQTEARTRDDSLRSELLQSSGTLKNQKVDRREMVQILVELAHRLQAEE